MTTIWCLAAQWLYQETFLVLCWETENEREAANKGFRALDCRLRCFVSSTKNCTMRATVSQFGWRLFLLSSSFEWESLSAKTDYVVIYQNWFNDLWQRCDINTWKCFYLCTVQSDICRVFSPTNKCTFINLKNTLKYTYLSLLHVLVFDHHQGACTEPG